MEAKGDTETQIVVNGNLNRSMTTRRTRNNINNNGITSLMEDKDQENVNNTKEEVETAEQSSKEDNTKNGNKMETKLQTSTTNINSSTPRRKKDPLANLHSNLSPKYIGFTTPPTQLDNSNSEERARSLRRRHNMSNLDTSMNKDANMSTESPFTPNNESTLGFVRRTPLGKDSMSTPDNSTRRKDFVSPIDKLLIKNGSMVESHMLLGDCNIYKKEKIKKYEGDGEEVLESLKKENNDKHQEIKEITEEVEENNSQLTENHTSVKENKEDNIFEDKVVSKSNKTEDSSIAEITVDTSITDKIEDSLSTDKTEDSLKTDKTEDTSNTDKIEDTYKMDKNEDTSNTDITEDLSNTDKAEDSSNTDQDSANTDQDSSNTDKTEVLSNKNYSDNQDEIEASANQDKTQVSSNQDEIEASSNQDKTEVSSNQDEIEVLSNQDKDEVLSNQDELEILSNQDELKMLSNQDEIEVLSNQDELKMLSNQDEIEVLSSNQDELEILSNQDELEIVSNQDETEISSTQDEFISIYDETEVKSNSDENELNPNHDEIKVTSNHKVNSDKTKNISYSEENSNQTKNTSNHEVKTDKTEVLLNNHEKYDATEVTFSYDENTGKLIVTSNQDETSSNNDEDFEVISIDEEDNSPTDPEKAKQDNTENLQEDEEKKYNISTTNESISESPDPSSTDEQNTDKSIVQMKLESVETECNVEFVDASTSAKSPSAISVDSAKGSSILNEGSWMSISTGDLFWGQIYNYCYWPCLVCPDPDCKTITTEDRSGDQHVLVHVRFFADNGRRNWVKRENLIPYTGIENYQERLEEAREKYGAKSARFKLYTPTKKKQRVWFEAVNEANIVSEVPYADRLEKFYEVFEKSKAHHRLQNQRRKSMYLPAQGGSTSDIESLYGSHDNINTLTIPSIKQKRERSISPYSPAYSPVKSVKRRKLSEGQELPPTSVAATSNYSMVKSEDNQQHSNELNLSQTNSVASSTTTNSLNDLDMFNGLEFKKFYSTMKDFVMEQNQNEKLEKSLVVAVRNIWALKQLSRHQMERKLRESLTENDMSSPLMADNARQTGGDGSLKRLSTRLKTLMVRKSLLSQAPPPSPHTATPERSITPKPVKEKPQLNRPILEVIDDIFELDNKYLFKGMNRDPVCKYCFKSGSNLKRCAKNCNNWLHSECLHVDFTINGKAIKRANKRVSSIRSNNDAMDGGSLNSSLVELTSSEQITEVSGSVTHVTGDSEGEAICKECANNEPTKCMVCKCTESTKDDDPLVKCTMSQCDRAFHPACCKYWPQSKITISKNHIESFRCPSHVCHTCVSDDPKGKFQHISGAKLIKCVKCPATFHTDSTCIPAGSQMLSAAYIICPRHTSMKHDMTVNVNWCFICVGGGQVVCCETCPTAVHAQCLKIPIAANEGYICEECESGRMPLYGEMVWAKFNNFRWWPAIILPPTEIPKNIAKKIHNPSDFVVRFFGTHDHGWISRRRVYLYLEGDSSEPPKSKSNLDVSYNRGVEEAKEVYEIIKDKKLQQRTSNESKEKLHPQPYVRIKANRAVPPVKLHVDMDSVSKCECDPNDVNPCGPDTSCLNRVLYHECNPKMCPAGERCQNQMFESRISPRLDVIYMKERGFGLVSREAIKAGTFVIEYVGEVISDNEFQARMQQKSRDRDENFYFLSVEKDYIIDAGPKGNLARFMNHSCDPNCETQKWSVNSLNRVGLFAIKDIPENTELTFNYHWDDLLGNEKKTCFCGAKKCAGQIGAKLKDIESTKEPSTSGIVKNKSKKKTKSKAVKRLGRPPNKPKFNVKTKTKKKAVVAAVSALLEANNNSKSPLIKEDDPEEVDAASSSNRTLQSPDLFC